MCKKIIITIGILLCALNSIAFAEKERLTRTDYLNLLNEYIKESNIKINTVYKTYEDKITANKELIKKLAKEEDQIGQQLRNCYVAQDNAEVNSLINGSCGHLYGKTTYFKTSSGLIIADDTYALNKCLAKQPITKKNKADPCKILNDKYEKIKKNTEYYNNQFSVFEKERDTELNKIKIDAQNKSSELTNSCKQTYPKKQLFGYCDGLEVNFTTD